MKALRYKSKVIKLNSISREKRLELSREYCEFEKQFTYPLNESQLFRISHGGSDDYFKFFERLGDVHIVDIRLKDELVGIGAVVLRSIAGVKFWYLCDFKITKKHRKKGILALLFAKKFLTFRKITDKFIFFNMSKKEKNGLIAHFNKITSYARIAGLDLNASSGDLYFYQFSADCEEKLNLVSEVLLNGNFGISSTYLEKDILIDEKLLRLSHLEYWPFELIKNKPKVHRSLKPEHVDANHDFIVMTTDAEKVAILEQRGLKPSTKGCFVQAGLTPEMISVFSTSDI